MTNVFFEKCLNFSSYLRHKVHFEKSMYMIVELLF